jgi:hypothetical protein
MHHLLELQRRLATFCILAHHRRMDAVLCAKGASADRINCRVLDAATMFFAVAVPRVSCRSADRSESERGEKGGVDIAVATCPCVSGATYSRRRAAPIRDPAQHSFVHLRSTQTCISDVRHSPLALPRRCHLLNRLRLKLSCEKLKLSCEKLKLSCVMALPDATTAEPLWMCWSVQLCQTQRLQNCWWVCW